MTFAPSAAIISATATPALDRQLVERFLAGDVTAHELPAPPWGPIGREVYERTYSRRIVEADGSECQELWAETARRMVLGNIGFAPAETTLPNEAAELFELLYTFKAIPAGRHLWVTGTDSPYSRSCWTSGWSARTSDHFAYLASRLFEGGGVGAGYGQELLFGTQQLLGNLDVSIQCSSDHPDYTEVVASAGRLFTSDATATGEQFPVADSREGWVQAWVRMIDLACTPGDHTLQLNVSDIREHGAPLKTFGGTASGPGPLAAAIRGIQGVLTGARGRRLTGGEAMSIDHEIAASVVAGGTRRSARMAMMRWDDPEIFEFINCKADHTRHWTTNISVDVDEKFAAAVESGEPHATAVLQAVSVGMAANGEPGLVDTHAHSIGEPIRPHATNPCGEIALTFGPADAAGESCNIGSVDLASFGTDTLAAQWAFRLMARFLYRATLNPYPGEAASRIERRNRRIGVGVMGLQGWLAANGVKLTELADHRGLKETLTGFRLAARDSADVLAGQLGLPRSIKVTAVAPTGSIAQLGGTTPGIHAVFGRYFLRRVRYASNDPKLEGLAGNGYTIVDDVYAANTKVVEFPQQDTLAAKYGPGLIEQADEISFLDFLRMVEAVQSTLCGGLDGNAVSATAALPENSDPTELAAAMRQMLGKVKGITAFPEASGRQLAPYERITEDQFNAAAEKLFYAELAELTGDSNSGECAGGTCPVK